MRGAMISCWIMGWLLGATTPQAHADVFFGETVVLQPATFTHSPVFTTSYAQVSYYPGHHHGYYHPCWHHHHGCHHFCCHWHCHCHCYCHCHCHHHHHGCWRPDIVNPIGPPPVVHYVAANGIIRIVTPGRKLTGVYLNPNTHNWETIPELQEHDAGDPNYDHFYNRGLERWAVARYPEHCKYRIYKYIVLKREWVLVMCAERQCLPPGQHPRLPSAEDDATTKQTNDTVFTPKSKSITRSVSRLPLPAAKPPVATIFPSRKPAVIDVSDDLLTEIATTSRKVSWTDRSVAQPVAPKQRQSIRGAWGNPSEMKIMTNWDDASAADELEVVELRRAGPKALAGEHPGELLLSRFIRPVGK